MKQSVTSVSKSEKTLSLNSVTATRIIMSQKEQADENNGQSLDWTPLEAMAWLKRRRGAARLGKDYFALTLDVLRSLIRERAELNKQVSQLEQEIARLQKLKTPVPFGVEGQGQWGQLA